MKSPNATVARAILSVLALLTVAPIVAISTLVLCNPSNWVADATPVSIIGFVIFAYPFALITTPLWPTYIPVIVITPLVMKQISLRQGYSSLPLKIFLLRAFPIGMVAGIGVMSVVIFMACKDSPDAVLSWVGAGAISGGVTFTLIALVYRRPKNHA